MAGINSQPTSHAKALYEQGRQQRASGDIGGAIASFNQALKAEPDFADACFELATLLDAAGQKSTAIKMHAHWLRIVKPARHDASVEEGAKLLVAGRFEEAETLLLAAASARPGDAEALNALGSCWRQMGQITRAVAAYQQALTADKTMAAVWSNLGRALAELPDWDGAIAAYEQALSLKPSQPQIMVELLHLYAQCCRWEAYGPLRDALGNALANGGTAEAFKVLLHLPARQYENAKRFTVSRWPGAKAYDASFPLPFDARGDGKLRIGYLSSDFHTHATMALIAELFEHHDRSWFEIYGYSCGADDKSADRARAARAMDVFRDCAQMNDEDAARLIRSDGIDILVDLKGHTFGHRLGVMALRPAPIQMHYLGYPGTTGGHFMDYFIADPVAAPAGAEAEFTEKLIRLPHSYQANDRNRPLPAKSSRRDHGLPDDGFVFCDFNAPYKITAEIFALWMRLLNAVPGSVLWLYSMQKVASTNLRNEARRHGVDPSRLIIAGAAPMVEHLARYRHVDLFLDTAPVCGHTTMSDALWCGVPAVTLAGDAFVSRVAASLLAAVSLPELAVRDMKAYETLALTLVKNSDKLAQLKRHLSEGRMQFPLFDSVATARAIETAYHHAADLHRAGTLPRSFTVTETGEVL